MANLNVVGNSCGSKWVTDVNLSVFSCDCNCTCTLVSMCGQSQLTTQTGCYFLRCEKVEESNMSLMTNITCRLYLC